MKSIIFILIALSATANASSLSVAIPLFTKHIGDSKYDYNENNRGIALEMSYARTTYGVSYFEQNSYSEQSTALYGIYKLYSSPKKVNFSLGAALATGYEKVKQSKIIPIPFLSADYEGFRIITSYPVVALVCNSKNCASDFINLQYIFSF